MAVVTSINATEGLDMLGGSQFSFSSQDGGVLSSTAYSWLTSGGDDVQAYGTGITYSGTNPTGGTVTSLEFDFNDDNFGTPDITVSGFSGSLVTMTNNALSLLTEVFSGNDTINGTNFGDNLKGVGGNDVLIGNGGNDFLYGGAGNDRLYGGSGVNSLYGDAGNDTLYEDNGDGLFDGGSGNDRIVIMQDVVGSGDTFRGGDGIDIADFSGISNAGREVDLLNNRWEATPGSATFETLQDFENVYGGTGSETINGSNVDNLVNGNAGNDVIFGNGGIDDIDGGSGNDQLYGGDGNDSIRGNSGNDYLSGGNDDDRFEYYNGTAFGDDTIFGGAGDDKIYLSGAGTFDLRDFQLGSLEEIEFRGDGSNIDKILQIDADEINDGFAGGLLLDSNGALGSDDRIDIYMDVDTTLDMSEWTFSGWQDHGVSGATGDDRIRVFGDTSSETITASDQTDELYGGDGNDRFRVYAADNTSSNFDSFYGGNGTDTLLLSGIGTFDHGTTTTQISSIERIEFEAATFGNRLLILNAQELDSVSEFSSTLEVDGYNGGGIDNIRIVMEDVSSIDLSGWTFIDWGEVGEGIEFIGDGSSETIVATSVDDTAILNGGNDTATGNGGRDSFFGGAGNDLLYGGADDDVLEGGTGNDTSVGGAGNDRITDAAGDDYLNGEGGDDILGGGIGNDFIVGGTGNDILRGFGDDDSLFGQNGNDEMTGGTGEDYMTGGAGNDSMLGQGDDDIMLGQGGQDDMNGGQGNDFLYGGAGNDTLVGNVGADTLDGGAGQDTLRGSSGADVFLFSSAADSTAAARDQIGTWEAIDLIDLSLIDAIAGGGGANDAFTWVGTGAHSGAGGTLRYFSQGGSTIISGDTTGDGNGDFAIQIVGSFTFTAADFIL